MKTQKKLFGLFFILALTFISKVQAQDVNITFTDGSISWENFKDCPTAYDYYRSIGNNEVFSCEPCQTGGVYIKRDPKRSYESLTNNDFQEVQPIIEEPKNVSTNLPTNTLNKRKKSLPKHGRFINHK